MARISLPMANHRRQDLRSEGGSRGGEQRCRIKGLQLSTSTRLVERAVGATANLMEEGKKAAEMENLDKRGQGAKAGGGADEWLQTPDSDYAACTKLTPYVASGRLAYDLLATSHLFLGARCIVPFSELPESLHMHLAPGTWHLRLQLP